MMGDGIPQLDFLSVDFDALLALTTPGVRPPVPGAKPLDNLYKCRRLLPADHPMYMTPAVQQQDPAAAAERDRAKQRVSYLEQKRQRERGRSVNLIDDIASRFQEGPLVLARQWYEQRAAVRVVTRHDRGVRGVATGTLVAFDKHLNLVLREVEERYSVLVWTERTTAGGGKRRARKQEWRQRRLKQVFIAGSGVVMVSLASGFSPNNVFSLSVEKTGGGG